MSYISSFISIAQNFNTFHGAYVRLKFPAQYTKMATEQRTAGVSVCGRTIEGYQMKIRTEDNYRLHGSGRLEYGYVKVWSTDPVVRMESCC
jgi:hypothetical protein